MNVQTKLLFLEKCRASIGSAGNGNDIRGDRIADDGSIVLLLIVMILRQAWTQMTNMRRMFLFQRTIRSPDSCLWCSLACSLLFYIHPVDA